MPLLERLAGLDILHNISHKFACDGQRGDVFVSGSVAMINKKNESPPISGRRASLKMNGINMKEYIRDNNLLQDDCNPYNNISNSAPAQDLTVYTPPRGMIGEIAQFIYSAAPRPVPEIALAAAMGIMSGITGRCYNISGTGLNQYIVLLARTGTGKEQMSSGISKLLGSISSTVKDSYLFYGPSKIQSQEALLKHLSKTSKSFVSLMGEFPDTLKKMLNDSRNPTQQGVKQVTLDL